MKISAFFSLVFGLLPLDLTAQNEAAVSTRLLTYSPAGLPDDFEAYFRTGEDVLRFGASSATLGVGIDYYGPRSFVLRSSEGEFQLPADSPEQKPPVASVTLPERSDLVLILCVPRPSGEFGLLAYDVSSDKLSAGAYRMFNFSTKELAIILGEQRLVLAPAKDRVVEDRRWSREVVALPLQIAVSKEQSFKMVYSNFWEHYPQRKNLIFLFDGRHPSNPVIFSSFDVSQPPSTAAVQP